MRSDILRLKEFISSKHLVKKPLASHGAERYVEAKGILSIIINVKFTNPSLKAGVFLFYNFEVNLQKLFMVNIVSNNELNQLHLFDLYFKRD